MSGGRWREVPPASAWGEMEGRVLAFWRERNVFERSLENRRGAQPWRFFEGPPTANGRPGSHHVLARVFKDIFPRFQTMRGRFVDRRGGWDCHGLPVELEVEKRLGISGKPQIEAYGIAEFNALCRESVVAYVDEWERLTERIGFWVDTGRAYRTMDTDYIESVWWSLARLFRENRLYRSGKVVPYCPRCGTALSSHEVALGYMDVEDPSVFVRLPLAGSDESLLVWTTTPWTLPANQAAAVNPDVVYAAVEHDGETLVLAEARVEAVLGEGARVMRTFPASELVGREYAPPFPFVPGAHRVVPAGFVTTDDGTGIVHIAPAFGEDDMATGREHGLDAPNPVGPDGRYLDVVGPWAGRGVKEADPELVADLDARGLLLRAESFTHAYPHCWRCGTPLIYYAKPSWYVRTTEVRDRMLELNAGIGWHPERVRDGRFGKWLEGNVDWAISRDRYWGTPLPLWRCGGCDEVEAIGSFAELRERAAAPLPEPFDPHRPFVDDVVLGCGSCGGEMRREPEVIDVWYDSGAMPYAQDHHPFATGGEIGERVPADYICEALDQTRGWFYSLLAEAALLFDDTAYRNVVCLGLMLDADGQKMSKSRGNVIDPWTVLDRQGADAFRWYLLTAQSPWESFRFSLEAVDEAMRRFLLTLWNTHSFLVTYASLPDGWAPGGPPPAPGDLRPVDRWILSRLDATVATVTERLDGFDATGAGRAIEGFLDDLSNWYVRTQRRRFWGGRGGGAGAGARADGDAAFATLHECLATLALLVAPFCPFVAEELHGTLVAAHDPDAPESVHLADWPSPRGRRDEALEAAMAAAREAVAVGRGARAEAKLKVRQPLAEAVVACAPALAERIGGLVDLVAEELNVRAVRFVTDPGELVEVSLKPNYRRLGPRFGKRMPAVAEAVAALEPAAAARALDAGQPVEITLDGVAERLDADDLLREARPSEGYAVGQDAALAVGLATAITDDLRLEALAREVVHAVQGARRAAGLRVEERIALHLDGSGLVREAIDRHRDEIAAETLATSLSVSHGAPFAGLRHEELMVDGEPLALRLERAGEAAPAV
ncbi:isoleucine--tRNA ligase [Miltoncostaea marina]|uniref:isoleucine--tRNA ligase n=1 Tax=Miltoncostaea marina TaxID=2843215 RepID=UPI001C3E06DF|nr:isoleucine--tRNA ligase [Miltoncostaea marina]